MDPKNVDTNNNQHVITTHERSTCQFAFNVVLN